MSLLDGSADLYSKLTVKQWQEDLKGVFVVGQGSEDLYAKFESQTVRDLYAKFEAQATAVLYAKFEITHSENLYAKFETQATASLYAKFEAQTTVDLYAKFEAQATVDLYADFELAQWEDLKGVFISRLSSTAALKGILIVRHTATKDLYAKFKAAIVFSGTPRNLFSKFFVGVDATRDLYAEFEITEEIGLPAEFIVSHTAILDLFADFRVVTFFNEGWGELDAVFIVRHMATKDLYAKFESQAIRDLYAKFEAQAIRDLYARFETQGIANLYAKFTTQVTADLTGTFIVRHTATKNLHGFFHAGQDSTDLKGIFIARQAATATLKGILTVRQATTEDLHAFFHAGQDSTDLKNILIVRHSTTKDLQTDFYVRWPYRLWTTRRYINGVIDSPESLVGDSTLEYTIEGVMDDIKTYLAANQITTYTGWHTIEDVPIQIRRAATYGTVASLYSRHTKTFSSRVIPSVAPVTVTVKGDQWEAMEYWENRYEIMMQRYLAYVQTGKLFSSTADEEPVFTMEDIPPAGTTYQNWHEWITG